MTRADAPRAAYIRPMDTDPTAAAAAGAPAADVERAPSTEALTRLEAELAELEAELAELEAGDGSDR